MASLPSPPAPSTTECLDDAEKPSKTPPSSNENDTSSNGANPQNRVSKRTQNGNGAARKRQHYLARPNCTHVNMVKLYGNWNTCHICGRPPLMGFLYACEQDHTQGARLADRHKDTSAAPRSSSIRRFFALPLSGASKGLDTRGISTWIADAATKGLYSHEQLQAIIAQKSNVRNMIVADQAQHSQPSSVAVIENLKRLGLTHLASSSSPASDKTNFNEMANSTKRHKQPQDVFESYSGDLCDFKVCHTCRPVSRDRVWISFEAAMNDEVDMPTEWHPFTMPVIASSTVRRIESQPQAMGFSPAYGTVSSLSLRSISSDSGINNAPSETSSGDSNAATIGASSNNSLSLRSQSSSMGFRSSLRKSLVDLLRARQDSSRSSSCGAVIHGDWTSEPREMTAFDMALARLTHDDSIGSLESGGLDIELWRALAEDQQRAAASVGLPGENDSAERLDLYDHSNYPAPTPQIHDAGGPSIKRFRNHNEIDENLERRGITSRAPSSADAEVEDAAKRLEQASMDTTEVAEGECLVRAPRNASHSGHDGSRSDTESRDRSQGEAFGLGVTMTEEAVENRELDFIIASV